MGSPYIEVAAAVILNPRGEVLLAQRPAGKVYAGYWEFPGGKVDSGETIAQALARELREELGIEIAGSTPWITQVFTYPHGTVRLHFRRVRHWQGVPHGREGQAFSWQRTDGARVTPMLPANGPVLKALALPEIYGITNASEWGMTCALERIRAALQGELRLVQVREKEMSRDELRRFARDCVELAQDHGARVLVNSDWELAREVAAAGVQLTAKQLVSLSARPPVALCGASCHSREELQRAAELNLDFAVLGAVQATASHPNVAPLGWRKFEEIVKGSPLPVFAIGGLQRDDLTIAQQHGAHGIAMLRGAWT